MIKLALIGVGYWGPNILRNLVENPNCEILFVVDISEENRNKIKQSYPNLNVIEDIDKIYKDKELQAVIIATPVATHYNLAIDALNMGKHVLVEKPMALNVNEVAEIEKLSDNNTLVAMVGHTFLYNSAVRKIKEIIESGEIGQIRYIYSQRLNLGRIRNDVNALWNLAPHDVSIIQYWLDDLDPISVAHSGKSYLQEEIEDVSFLNISYPNDIIANIHVSWLDPNKVRKTTIVGSKKMIIYDDMADKKISLYDKGIDIEMNSFKSSELVVSENPIFKYRSGEVSFPSIEWVEPLKMEISHFIDCIVNDTECITGPRHAKGVVRILSL